MTYSRAISVLHGMAFWSLAVSWLRLCGVQTEMTIPTDWGKQGAGRTWLYDYHYERVHSGYGMEGRMPYECCVALGFRGSVYVGLMSVV